MLIEILLMASLVYIFYQDLRYRAVYWWCFPLVVVFLLVIAARNTPIYTLVVNSLYNMAFLLLQLVILTLYFSLRRKKMVILTRGLLGWGDILLLLCLAFYCPPLTYLLFYISSLILVLFFTILSRLKNKEAGSKVPLAGLQALFFVLLLVADRSFSFVNLTSDDWILYLLQ